MKKVVIRVFAILLSAYYGVGCQSSSEKVPKDSTASLVMSTDTTSKKSTSTPKNSSPQVFKNDFFQLALNIPSGWHTLPASTFENIYQNMVDSTAGIQQKDIQHTSFLLITSQYAPEEQRVDGSSIMIMKEFCDRDCDPMKFTKDMISQTKATFEEMKHFVVKTPPTLKKIGHKEYIYTEIAPFGLEMGYTQSYYIHQHQKHYLVINISSTSETLTLDSLLTTY